MKNSFKIASIIILGLTLSNAGFPMGASEKKPPRLQWSFNGPFGTFDRAQLQRGFQVYKEVCAACHSLNLLSYRNLEALGFSKEEVKAIAKEAQIAEMDDEGKMADRPGKPEDKFHNPYPTEAAARAANNGALPPDLSLIIKARAHGPDYLHALLTGFQDPPADVKMGENMHYNEYFPGNQIAMTAPLSEGMVTYSDGTSATVNQMADDVTAFLAWAAEPEMEQRKHMGVMVLIYLLIFTSIMYMAKRRIWARLSR